MTANIAFFDLNVGSCVILTRFKASVFRGLSKMIPLCGRGGQSATDREHYDGYISYLHLL